MSDYDDDWAYWQTVAYDQADYHVKLLALGRHSAHPEPPQKGHTICDICWAGDGDARCLRCGCSDGWPGCQCELQEPPRPAVFGPCVREIERTDR